MFHLHKHTRSLLKFQYTSYLNFKYKSQETTKQCVQTISSYKPSSKTFIFNNHLLELNQYDNSSKRNSRYLLHTSSITCKDYSDIPDYLIDSISEVQSLEQEKEDLKVTENDMEEDVSDYLISRCISYDETDSSFIVQCPSCSHNKDKFLSQDIFVDKHTGN